MAGRFRAWLSEPLVHFAVIGLGLYLLSVVFSDDEDSTRRIVVTPSVYSQISKSFVEGRGRKPTAEEMKPLAQTWVSNEVLYREAKALQLDSGDDMIRERIMQKMRVMIAGGIEVPDPTEEDLRTFFEDHRDNYDLPPFLDFAFARLNASRDEAAAKAAAWNALENMEPGIDQGVHVLRFKTRARPLVVKMLGETATARLEDFPVGEWWPLEGPKGWAVARLDRLDPAEPATFEDVSGDVEKRWKQMTYRNIGSKAVADMKKGYEVVYLDPPADSLAGSENDETAEAGDAETGP